METSEVKHAGPLRVDVPDSRLLEEAVHDQLLVVAHLGEVLRELAILPHARPDQGSGLSVRSGRTSGNEDRHTWGGGAWERRAAHLFVDLGNCCVKLCLPITGITGESGSGEFQGAARGAGMIRGCI